tara:strand:+ start:931 stop:1554 length:624 start_codon:yes stop_codon:yes gene_type:complete
MAFKMKHLGGGNPPTHMHGDPHAIDPVKAKAEAEAKANASNAPKVYSGGSRNMVTNPDGTKTLTSTRNYTQTGTGKAGKDLGPGYKPSAETTARANKAKANKTISGSESETITSINLKPMGITPSSPKISSTIPTITSRGPSTPPEPKKKKKKSNRRKSYIVQDTGRAIGDVGEAIGKGVGDAFKNVGYVFSRRGAIGSLFGCKTCR